MTRAQQVVDRIDAAAFNYDVESRISLDEISLDEARTDSIDMRLAEFVVFVSECSSRRALSLIRAVSTETPLKRLAIALVATRADIRTAQPQSQAGP